MPISFTIYEGQELFVSLWAGSVSDLDMLSSYKDLFENEQYKPGYNEIVDARNAQMDGVTSVGLRNLASMVNQYLSGKTVSFKTAIIAPANSSFGISRMYEVFANDSPEQVRVFREPNDALEWIGVKDFHLE